MSELIGIQLLNQTFEQDPKKDWIKINQVAIGESHIYSYKTVGNNDISKLLDSVINDNNTVCVVYDWRNGIGYIKSGFNLSDKSDYQNANGFTTFIVKNKIPLFYNKGASIITLQPSVPINSNDIFITLKNGDYIYKGIKFIPVGFNAYWLGITEQQEYPEFKHIEEIFIAAQKMNATVIRSHTLGYSSGNRNSLRQPGNKINNNAWKSIDYSFLMAKKYNIKLICPIMDCYYWYNGNYVDFCKDYNIPKNNFFTDNRTINDFKKYIYNWLNHINQFTNIAIKDSPEIFAIETGNEYNIRPDATSYIYPPESWNREITGYIKSQDTNHLILHGTDEGLGKNNDFNISTIDIFTGHFYGEDYNRLNYGYNSAKNIKKGYIIGESGSRLSDNWYTNVEKLNLGSFVWSMYYHIDGTPNGQRVQHDDGNTIWYDSQSDENIQIITRITKHFRRLQKLI